MNMEKKIVASAKAPKAVGTYSQAVIAGNTIYVSGQLPIDAATGEFVPGGIEEQLHQVFKNLQYVLEEGGYSFADVVKTTVLLSDLAKLSFSKKELLEFEGDMENIVSEMVGFFCCRCHKIQRIGMVEIIP